ncbi:MAG: hypothetical protein EPN89_13045 [Methylovulum sp.]|nr:MAG: hypothetical protein EPN89_13045 [Methylovulum sp.]
MSLSQPTFDDVWKLFQETSKGMREMSQEFDRKLEEDRKERREMSQDTDKIIREMSQDTDKIIREMSQDTDKRIREMSRDTDKRIKQVTESIGRLGNKLGDFVEEMVRPAAVRLFRERGIDVHEVHQNVSANRHGEGIEVDLLVVNDGDVIAIECKSSLSIDDVNEHLKRLEKLKRLLPAYASKQVMGAVTGMVIPDNVAQYAYRQGLYVIAQTGDHLAVRNDMSFQAKIW